VLAELIDRVDVVFHLAAAVGVRLIVESPVNTSRRTSTAPSWC
jgi:UDP-glucose 4-epimerase